MPINTLNKSYESQSAKVKRVKDCYEGSDAIKAAGELYLPRLDSQSDDKYNAYKMRGKFLSVIKSTVTAFTGSIMRKPATVESNVDIDSLIADTNGKGRNINLLASKLIKELNLSGRTGVLVEHTGDRPILLNYNFESIINWSNSYIVLTQTYTKVDPKDKYKSVQAIEYLELTFDESGYYIQNIYRVKGRGFVLHNVIEPTIRGVRLDFIPFVVGNPVELGFEAINPPLLDIADVNLNHYRLSTDENHGLHWTALPTMFLFGEMKDENGRDIAITVGAGSANHITDTDGRAELLEFTGAGLSALRSSIEDDLKTMASMGAKMLQNPTNGVRSTETARIEASGESATLSSMANSVEAMLEVALTWAALWEGSTAEISVKLNRDYLDTTLDPQMISALLQTYHGGAMSLDSLLDNLSKGELLPKGRTVEEEKDLINNEGQSLNLDVTA